MDDPLIRESIELCGKNYLLKPSFKALVLIEKHAESSIVHIIERYTKYDTRCKDVAAILYGLMVGADPEFKMSFDQIGELVYEHSCEKGMTGISLEAFTLISNVLAGDGKKKVENTSKKK